VREFVWGWVGELAFRYININKMLAPFAQGKQMRKIIKSPVTYGTF